MKRTHSERAIVFFSNQIVNFNSLESSFENFQCGQMFWCRFFSHFEAGCDSGAKELYCDRDAINMT